VCEKVHAVAARVPGARRSTRCALARATTRTHASGSHAAPARVRHTRFTSAAHTPARRRPQRRHATAIPRGWVPTPRGRTGSPRGFSRSRGQPPAPELSPSGESTDLVDASRAAASAATRSPVRGSSLASVHPAALSASALTRPVSAARSGAQTGAESRAGRTTLSTADRQLRPVSAPPRQRIGPRQNKHSPRQNKHKSGLAHTNPLEAVPYHMSRR